MIAYNVAFLVNMSASVYVMGVWLTRLSMYTIL